MTVKVYGPGWCMELPVGVNQAPHSAPTTAGGDLQDGMLAYYLSQSGQSDANIERRIEREPFDFLDFLNPPPVKK